MIHFTRGQGSSGQFNTGNKLFDNMNLFSSSTSNHSLDNPCPGCGYRKTFSGVTSSCLDCFLWGGELYLFEYSVNTAFFIAKVRGGTCSIASSDPPEDVLHRAYYLLREGDFGVYDLFENNCEDFAVYCKTGLLAKLISVGSGQAATSLLAASSVIVSSPLQLLMASLTGIAAVGLSMFCISQLVSDIGVRCDVAKVPVEMLGSCFDPSMSQYDDK